jgi:hypothetical protein
LLYYNNVFFTQPYYGKIYVDDELKVTSYIIINELTWSKLSFGKHILKILFFNGYRNRASDEI